MRKMFKFIYTDTPQIQNIPTGDFFPPSPSESHTDLLYPAHMTNKHARLSRLTFLEIVSELCDLNS